jgi:hypothetical protein
MREHNVVEEYELTGGMASRSRRDAVEFSKAEFLERAKSGKWIAYRGVVWQENAGWLLLSGFSLRIEIVPSGRSQTRTLDLEVRWAGKMLSKQSPRCRCPLLLAPRAPAP